MLSQREQYESTVHLFIGTGHSPYKITSMPFTFGSNSIVIHRGLNSLFIFKSVSFSAITPKLSCLQLRRCVNLRILWASPTVVPIRIRRYLFTHYTPETLLNHVFEDLRKPKAPNTRTTDKLLLQVQTSTWGAAAPSASSPPSAESGPASDGDTGGGSPPRRKMSAPRLGHRRQGLLQEPGPSRRLD
jgi:hypothetical protein